VWAAPSGVENKGIAAAAGKDGITAKRMMSREVLVGPGTGNCSIVGAGGVVWCHLCGRVACMVLPVPKRRSKGACLTEA